MSKATLSKSFAKRGYYSSTLGPIVEVASHVARFGVIVGVRPSNIWFDEKNIRLLFDDRDPVTGRTVGEIVTANASELIPLNRTYGEHSHRYGHKVFEILAFFMVQGEIRWQVTPFGTQRCRFEDRYCAVADYGFFGLDAPEIHTGNTDGVPGDRRIRLVRAAALDPLPELTT